MNDEFEIQQNTNFHSHIRPIDLYSSTEMMELWWNNEEKINIFDVDWCLAVLKNEVL